MVLTGAGPAQMLALTEALRSHGPVPLTLSGGMAWPADWAPEEWGPLFAGVDGVDAAMSDALRRWRAPTGDGAAARLDEPPAVTAVIPCSRGTPIGVAALRDQDVPVRVLVLSNGPSGPRQVPGAEVLRVPWLGHGATRQAALAHVRTPYVLFSVDDARLLGRGCVRALVDELEGAAWDAVVARQLPWPDSDAVTRARLRAWTPASRGAVEVSQTDHVATVYRTRDLRRWPLPSVPIAEDLWWSQGRTVGCVGLAPVAHAHRRRASALFRRDRAIHRERARMGLPATVPSLPSLLAALPSCVRVTGSPAEPLNQLAELLGQWLGARAATPGVLP